MKKRLELKRIELGLNDSAFAALLSTYSQKRISPQLWSQYKRGVSKRSILIEDAARMMFHSHTTIMDIFRTIADFFRQYSK